MEQVNYRNLVWLGRPANVASKLTDAANKPEEGQMLSKVRVAYEPSARLGALYDRGFGGGLGVRNPSPMGGLFGLGSPTSDGQFRWNWETQWPRDFLRNINIEYAPSRITHSRQDFRSFHLYDEYVVLR